MPTCMPWSSLQKCFPQTQPSAETLKCKIEKYKCVSTYIKSCICVTFGEGARIESLKFCHHYIIGDFFETLF